jgi:DNA-binding beta-propeller fold protein YncE
MKYLKTLGLAAAVTALYLVACDQPINTPPDPPTTPEGPATGRADSTYTFTTTAADPDADSVCVRFDWGDGDTSDWSGFVASGESVSMEHQWYSGTHSVSAQAKDIGGILSDWSDAFSISIRPWPPYPTEWIGTVVLPENVEYTRPAVSPRGDYVYFPIQNGVCVLRTADNSVYAEVAIPDAWALTLSTDGSELYVLDGDGGIHVVRTSDYEVTRTAQIGNRPDEPCLLPDGQLLYIPCSAADSVAVLRLSDLTVIASISTPDQPSRAASTPDGRFIYVGCNECMCVVRTADNRVVDTILGVDCDDGDIVMHPNGEYLYTYDWPKHLIVARTSDNTVRDTIRAWGERMTIMPDGSYVLGTSEASIDVVDTRARAVVETMGFPGCECYHPIALLPDGSRFYVATHEEVHIFGHPGAAACPGRDRQSPCE